MAQTVGQPVSIFEVVRWSDEILELVERQRGADAFTQSDLQSVIEVLVRKMLASK